MTSLQHQLKKLSVPHVTQALDAKKVSLLFDAKDAASLDADDVLDLALEGLEELVKVNKSFARYRSLLFDKESTGFNRATCSKEVNRKLDSVLSDYLVEVSPYFLMRSAQQTVEWLVHRHQIHNFNVDDWISSVLPLHGSKIFVRILMILDLDDPTSRWHWLSDCAKNGVTLPRSVIINHCKKDVGFLRYLLSTAGTYVSILGADSSLLNERISFCFEVVLDIIKNVTDVTQETVATILEFLTAGIKSRCLLWESKCYEYLPRLTAMVTLTEEKIVHLCKVISRKHSEELIKSVILSLNFLVMVSESEIPERAFAKFAFSRTRLEEMVNVARVFDVLPLFRLLRNADASGVVASVLDQLDVRPEELTSAQEESMEVDDVEDQEENVAAEGKEAKETKKKKKESKLKFKHLAMKDVIEVISLLSSERAVVRQRCVKFITEKHAHGQLTEPAPLLKRIVKKREEIEQDDNAMSRIFERLFVSVDAKKGEVKKCLKGIIEFLTKEDTQVETQLALLKCIGGSDSEDVRAACLNLAKRHADEHHMGRRQESHVSVIKSVLEILSARPDSVKAYVQLVTRLLQDETDGRRLAQVASESLLGFKHQFDVEDNDAVLKLLLDVSMNSRGLLTAKVFRKFAFREEFLQRELNLAKDESEPKLKRMRVGAQNVDLPKAIFLLEVLTLPADADERRRVSNLLMSLLVLLSNESGSDVEYCRRLILVAVGDVVSSLSELGGHAVNVEVLVQCLRRSRSLQTQKQVLLVMAAVAPHRPRELLYNVVSVFSFMGEEFLCADDRHSFEVMDSAVDIVVSAVGRLGSDGAEEGERAIADVLRTFVDSRHHIPRHRFRRLVEKLLSPDVDGQLWRFVVMVVESYVCRREEATSEEQLKALLASEHEIVSTVAWSYPADVVLSLLVRLVRSVREVLAAAAAPEDGSGQRPSFSGVVDGEIVKQPRLRRLMLYHLSKVAQVLLSEEEQLSFDRIEDSGKVKSLVEDTVGLMHDIDARQKSAVRGSTDERFWPSLIRVVQGAFDRMNGFMPSALFVEAVGELVASDSAHVSCKGLELLNAHLAAVEKRGDRDSSLCVLDLVPLLVRVVESEDDGADPKPRLLSKQLSFLGLKLMMRIFGDGRREAFDACRAPIVACMDVEETSSLALTDSALLCLSDFVGVAKVRLLPHLDALLNNVVGLYRSERLLKSSVSVKCLNKAVVKTLAHLGKFVTGRLAELMIAVGKASSTVEKREEEEDFDSVFRSFAANVETRILVPALEGCYERLIKEDLRSVRAPFAIFREHCKTAVSKETYALHSDSIRDLVGRLLDVRHDGRKLVGAEQFDAIDGCLVEAVLPLVYLMNEATFKSAFGSYLARMTAKRASVVSFFRLLEGVAGILRGLFGMFSRSLVPLMVDLLGSSGPEPATFRACAGSVYRLISLCHVNDKDDSFAVRASEGLYAALADSMERATSPAEAAGPELEAELVDCFVQTAQSVKDQDAARALFSAVYGKLRHDSVRRDLKNSPSQDRTRNCDMTLQSGHRFQQTRGGLLGDVVLPRPSRSGVPDGKATYSTNLFN